MMDGHAAELTQEELVVVRDLGTTEGVRND